MIPKNVQMPNPNPKYKPPGTPAGGREGNMIEEREVCMTNAQKIRTMSDEELAKYLSNPCECTVDPERDGFRECGNDLCVKYLLEWLQQPAEEET